MQSRGFQDEHGNAPDLVLENQDYLSTMLRRSIEGELVPKYDFDMNGHPNGTIEGSIDVYKSTVKYDSLKEWLAYKGFKSGFFLS